MTDLADHFAQATEMIDSREVTVETPFEVRDLLVSVRALVSESLSRLNQLATDDPQKNEDRLVEHMHDVATKAFFAGYLAGPTDPSNSEVVVGVSAEQIEGLALSLLREGAVTFHLVAQPEDQS